MVFPTHSFAAIKDDKPRERVLALVGDGRASPARLVPDLRAWARSGRRW